MAKLLAVEWDGREMRLVGATRRGGRIVVTDVVSVPVEDDPARLGEVLRATVAERHWQKLPALVALGRGRTELRQLHLPPVPDEELPDMVRFQALQQFAAAGPQSSVDFIPTRRDEEGIDVVAAAASPEHLKLVHQVCEAAELAVERIALRPINAAALYASGEASGGGAEETLLIDVLADEADLVILRGGHPIFVRTVRLPEGAEQRVERLVGEARRSLMACQSGEASEARRLVVLWGRAEIHAAELDELRKALDADGRTLDPFSLVEVSPEVRLPEHIGRYAPLLGMLAAHAAGGAGLIDFLHPRQRPAPRSRRTTYLAIAAVAVLGGALVGSQMAGRLRSLDREIEALQSEIASLEPAIEMAEAARADVVRVDEFLDGNVFWLGELEQISEKLPPAEELVVESVTGDVNARSGNLLTLTGYVTEPEILTEVEQRLRDPHREVTRGHVTVTSGRAPYRWKFTEVMEISPAAVRASAETQAAEAQAAEAQAAETQAAEAGADAPAEEQESIDAAAPEPEAVPPKEAEQESPETDAAPGAEEVS